MFPLWAKSIQPCLQNLRYLRASRAIATAAAVDPWPASLELAVRGSYPLVVSGSLNADRGSLGNDQPDRRTPDEVLDGMRRSIQGVYQLRQARHDFAADRSIRAVDEGGQVKRLAGDSEDWLVNDIYMRTEFPRPGKAKPPAPATLQPTSTTTA